MSEVNYNVDLDTVIAYAMAPAEGIGAFLKAAEGQPVHFNNPHDRVLQDYLEEHDDPRHEIVRRHLEGMQRGRGGAVHDLYQRLGGGDSPFQFDQHRHNQYELPDGRLHLDNYTNTSDGRNGSIVSWEATHPDVGGARVFRAAMTPAEVKHLMKNLPVEGSGGLPVHAE